MHREIKENQQAGSWEAIALGGLAEAQAKVEEEVKLRPGSFNAGGGQFENFSVARQRIAIVDPGCFAMILLLLFGALGSARDALLVGAAPKSQELFSPSRSQNCISWVTALPLGPPMLSAMRYVVHATELSGVALAAYEIEAGCDDDAKRRAEIFLEAHPSIEIWDGVRHVARLIRAEAETKEQLATGAEANQLDVTDHEVKAGQKG